MSLKHHVHVCVAELVSFSIKVMHEDIDMPVRLFSVFNLVYI